MNKSITRPRKEFVQAVMIDFERGLQNPQLITDSVHALFESLEKKALNSLAQERLKKYGDGVCIRAWIVPANKVPPQTTY